MQYETFTVCAIDRDPADALSSAVQTLWDQANRAHPNDFRVVTLEHSSCVATQFHTVKTGLLGASREQRPHDAIVITATLTIELP